MIKETKINTFRKGPAKFCKIRLMYSNRAVSKSVQLTVLLEYIDFFYKPICDWIYGNHSKLHIGSYKIIDLKHCNHPRIVSTQTKLTQKIYHFTVFESLPNTSCCSQKLTWKKLAGWTCKVVSGMWVGGGDGLAGKG